VLAENLLASMLGLEVASGNDALASHSQIRKSAKLMLQFIPGTDFIFSGYSAVPRRDNMFGGGNFDAEDFDDYNVLQRDMQVDGGLRPVTLDEVLQRRRAAACAMQAIYAQLKFPPIGDVEVEAAVRAHASEDMPERDVVADLEAADRFLYGEMNVQTVVTALRNTGFDATAHNIEQMLHQRTLGDYLQPAAIFVPDLQAGNGAIRASSAITDPNDYCGPGTGYRVTGKRWAEIQRIPQAQSPRDFIADRIGTPLNKLHDLANAKIGAYNEVILAVGPAFGRHLTKTINGLDHEKVLEAIFTGVAKEGMTARLVRVYHTSDCAAIGYVGAELSGSGIAIGLQSRGTTVIHKKGYPRLHNLELFSFSPSLTLEIYENIGRNAAKYAQGKTVTPIKPSVDNWARLRLIVKTALLHRRETEAIENKKPQEVFFDWEPDF
jgi:hypothetical protein